MSFFVDPDVPGLHREVRSHGIASQFSEQTYRHEAIGSMRGVRIGESAPKRHQPPTVVGAHRYMRLNQHALPWLRLLAFLAVRRDYHSRPLATA